MTRCSSAADLVCFVLITYQQLAQVNICLLFYELLQHIRGD